MENKFTQTRDFVSEILELFKSDISDSKLFELLVEYHDNDIAGAFELLDEAGKKRLFNIFGEERFSEIFAYVENAENYITVLDASDAAKLLENMDPDDALDILDEVDDRTEAEIIKLMADESSRDIRLLRSYEDDEIGSRMTTNFIKINKNLTVKQAMRELISQAGENDNIITIYVSDETDRFYGSIALKDLITAREHIDLEDIISTSFPYLNDHEKVGDCIERLKEYTEDSFPVLNSDAQIVGIITAQDIVEAVERELSDDYAKLAGLTEDEEPDENVWQSIKKRIPWLIGLLVLGLGVSAVVGIFETLVSQVAVIVCFQSLILAMAGNAGTQSLAVTIRALAEDKEDSRGRLVLKEMNIGLVNGILLGVISFVTVGAYIFIGKAYPIIQAFGISACVGIAMVASMIISSLVGTCIPLLFNKMKIDPAVASGPLITTINDLVAVTLYYSIAWALLIGV